MSAPKRIPIHKIQSRTLVLPNANIDTDQIIPARFLTTVSRESLGEKLFTDWRYRPDRCWSPVVTLVAALRASMRRGHCSTMAFAR